ncbi:hypothetical protein ACFFX0_04220 [Citricoccus parietis]|uniref:Uncharacterized protein n=1 Tax=Citricoccus parietis TaxID=592307 RepID=A0ABV5FUT8_9MICC
MSCRASSGSRKKSPLMLAVATAPSETVRSAMTSLPPATLYSPWWEDPRGVFMIPSSHLTFRGADASTV